MDVAALVLALLALVFFLVPELTRWGLPLLTLALICQFTTISDNLVSL